MFELHSTYNFTTYAPAVIGGGFKRVKVVGIVDYDTAKKYQNVDLIQRQIFSRLPVGTPDRASNYSYLLVEDGNGLRHVIAYPWIIPDTVVKVTTVDLQVRVRGTDDTDMARLRNVLNSMGYSYTIEVLNA